MRKEEGKKRVPDYVTDRNKSDRCESDSKESDDGSLRAMCVSAEKVSTSVNEQLRRSTR